MSKGSERGGWKGVCFSDTELLFSFSSLVMLDAWSLSGPKVEWYVGAGEGGLIA